MTVLFDLDGTLAYQISGRIESIGDPIDSMIELLKSFLAAGENVKVFTARMSDDSDGYQEAMIKAWCLKNIGQELEVTNCKDFTVTALYDDKAISVVHNAGVCIDANELIDSIVALNDKNPPKG